MNTRRRFLQHLGVSAAALPFVAGLPGIAASAAKSKSKAQRVIFMFSPNGTVPWEFWPDAQGPDFQLKRILQPLTPFKDQLLILNGVYNKVDGDGDRHMRGMSCLLTGTELFPGNIQGGSDTPAGWAKGISIDQELKNFLQSREETRTRFGSLEFGVAVPNRAGISGSVDQRVSGSVGQQWLRTVAYGFTAAPPPGRISKCRCGVENLALPVSPT